MNVWETLQKKLDWWLIELCKAWGGALIEAIPSSIAEQQNLSKLFRISDGRPQ